MQRPIKAVLFDLDNTLYDRDQTFLNWAEWFVGDRLSLTAEEATAVVDLIVTMDAKGYGSKDAMFSHLKECHPCLVEEVKDLVAAFHEHHLDRISPLDDGASGLLSALDQAGVPWGIVTNGSPYQMLKVRRLGLDGMTPCIVISGVIGAKKPAPAIFHAATDLLGVDPRETLFVGDNPDNDVIGAARVGMQTAWLHRARAWPCHLADVPPVHVIGSLAELRWITETEHERSI